MKPLLSIITITYNDKTGLEKTLQSLQPLLEDLSWEHIIVDSSPEVNSPTLSKLKEWPLVRIETPPRGIYSAFNLGIEHAQGEFIWLLNGGDRLSSAENLKEILNIFKENSSVDLISAGVEFFRNNKFTYSSKTRDSLISNLIGQNNLCQQGIIYRRSVFDRVGKFDESFKLAGDYDHHFKCHLIGVGFKTFSGTLAQYDRDGRSDNFREVFKEYRKIWKTLTPHLETPLRMKNDFLAAAYFLRLNVMKSKLLGPISKPLKSVWYRLHT